MRRNPAERLAMRRLFGRYVALMCILAAAAAGWTLHQPVWAALRTHPYFAVTHLAIRGTGPLLSKNEILAWIGADESVRIWDLSPPHVRARLEMHPLIAHASVRREFPNSFEVEVREQRPRGIVLLDRLYYVGRSGEVLLPVEAQHDPDYPVVTGLTKETPPGYRTWALRRALQLYRLCQRMACFDGVSEIHVDSERGMVLYPMKPRVPVVLGWGSWREKIERAERVLGAWEGRTYMLRAVDLRYRNQVVTRLREAPAAKPKRQPASGRRWET